MYLSADPIAAHKPEGNPYHSYNQTEVILACVSLGFYVLLTELNDDPTDTLENNPCTTSGKIALTTLLFLVTAGLAGIIAGAIVLARESGYSCGFFSKRTQSYALST